MKKKAVDALAVEGLQLFAEPSTPKTATYYNLPDSPASNLIMDTISAGKDIGDLPARRKQVSRGTRYEVLENGKSRQINLSNRTESITLELPDIDKFSGSNKAAKKMFTLTLIKANEQAIHNGKLDRDCVSFPLQELVTLGMYSNIRSARKGFNDGIGSLTDIKIGGKMNIGKKNQVEIIGMHPFRYGKIERGQCYVYLEPDYNWAAITQYFTVIPQYYFCLPSNASDLLYYICYLARQNVRDLAERGYFTISMKAVQQKLCLPNEVGCRNQTQLIRKPIEDAVATIQSSQKATLDQEGLRLEIVANPSMSVTDFLRNGYLKVFMSGTFAEKFIELNEKREAMIEAKNQQRQRITENAAAIRMAKGGSCNEKS